MVNRNKKLRTDFKRMIDLSVYEMTQIFQVKGG